MNSKFSILHSVPIRAVLKISRSLYGRRVRVFVNKTLTTVSNLRLVTALFTNMRILKFKSQLTIAFFAAVNHLNGPLRKQNFTLTGSKGQGL